MLPTTGVDRVIVVSAGPSIKAVNFGVVLRDRYTARTQLVGVNHLVEKDYFDYWVCCDHEVFETAAPKGRPILFGHNDWHQRITAGSHLDAWYAWPKIHQNDVHRLMPPPTGDVPTYAESSSPCAQWNAFSGVAALGLAWILRPREIDLFGFDLEGEGGAADEGHDLERNRTPERWAMERRIFEWWMRAFGEAGIVTHRHKAGGAIVSEG